MKRSDESCWIAVAEARHSLSHTVENLDQEDTYQFRVRAENVHGLSEPGMESEIVTIPSADDAEVTQKAFGITTELTDDEDDFDTNYEAPVVSTEPGHLFEERYDVREELGKGKYGVVRKIVEKSSGKNFAAKIIRTIKAKDREQVHEEIAIMNRLRHPKLLTLSAAYESPKEMIMVTEYISGGELFERVVADDFTLTEKDVILFMRQICQGVKYMHDNLVVHLDLKPENIMCQTRTSHRIKLIDFGLAQTLKLDTPMRVLFGTPEFIPPEIISFEPIGIESDMWSVGVICYVLLTGLSPFMGENDAETFANITRADYDFDDKAFDAISQEAKDFISALLLKKKELRMSAEKCLQHPWLSQGAESMSRVALPTDQLKKFIVRRKWQKTGNAIRALGRMAILSANSRRNSAQSSPTKLSGEFTPDIDESKSISNNLEKIIPSLTKLSLNNEQLVSPKNEEPSKFSLLKIQKNPDEIDFSHDLSTNEVLKPINTSASRLKNLKFTELEDETEHLCIDEPESISYNDHSSADLLTEYGLEAGDDYSTDDDVINTETDMSMDDDLVTGNDSLKSLENTKDEENINVSTFSNVMTMENNKSVVKDCKIKHEEINTVENFTSEIKTKLENKKAIRPNFIPIQKNTHTVKSISKSRFETNSVNIEDEDEVTRLNKKTNILSRGVRTGSVSKTAKMFEQEETSLSMKQVNSSGSRIVLPTSDSRPKNDRVRQAFAFWNR